MAHRGDQAVNAGERGFDGLQGDVRALGLAITLVFPVTQFPNSHLHTLAQARH